MAKKQTPFSKDIISWFKKSQRKLPWRETENPYLIWVSEVMLQQTQVKQVLEYYQNFIDKFPDVFALAQADLQDVLKAWEGMGYYARARNLYRASKIVIEKFDGRIPSDYQNFRRLPGVGNYIAAAVLSQAFNTPLAVVDGNVKRVLARQFLIDQPVNHTPMKNVFQERADLLLDVERPGDFNQALMELGALICRPQNPKCDQCPVSSYCQAYQKNQQHQLPITTKRKMTPVYHIAVGVVHKNSHILITQRKPSGLLGGLWEFPGGKVEDGETAELACVREVKEKTNISVAISDYLTQVNHAYTHFRITVDVFRCDYLNGDVVLNGPYDYRWVTHPEIDQFPFHVSNQKIIFFLKKNLSKQVHFDL